MSSPTINAFRTPTLSQFAPTAQSLNVQPLQTGQPGNSQPSVNFSFIDFLQIMRELITQMIQALQAQQGQPQTGQSSDGGPQMPGTDNGSCPAEGSTDNGGSPQGPSGDGTGNNGDCTCTTPPGDQGSTDSPSISDDQTQPGDGSELDEADRRDQAGPGNASPSAGTTEPAQPGDGDDSGTTANPPQPQNNAPVNVVLVEVGAYNNGATDDHADSVKEVFQRNTQGDSGQVRFEGIGLDQPMRGEGNQGPQPTKLADRQALDEYIDSLSSGSLQLMTEKVNQIVDGGNERVVNASLGFTRDQIYINTTINLLNNPQLASAFGLKESDIRAIELDENGNPTQRVPEHIKAAVVRYVDNRMNADGSAFNTALGQYQAATQRAAQNGVTVVVAAGNDGRGRDLFPSAGRGHDTNFLAMSDHVISVAATNDNGTPDDPTDDKVADFSSRGDGRFNPTVAYTGVQVDTPSGKQDGTSFAAPAVAATVAEMLEANPDLTLEQVKQILQDTAHDIDPNSEIADGRRVVNPDRAIQTARESAGQATPEPEANPELLVA